MEEAGFGFSYEPSTEAEVIILFGVLMPYILSFLKEMGLGSSFFIDEWTENPTDCIMEIEGEKVRVEFELYSSNFRGKHDPEKCDLIVCWKNDWMNCPRNIKVLELKEVCEKIAVEKGLRLIRENRPKYAPRSSPYTLRDFMDALRRNVGDLRFELFKKFFEEIGKLKGVQLQTGKGTKIPNLGIGVEKFGTFPIVIEASGKAFIAYYNVNVKPPKPLLPVDLMERVWKLVGAPKTKRGEMKKWHYIRSMDTADLIKKLRELIDVMLEIGN